MEWADAFPGSTIKPSTFVRRHSDSTLHEDTKKPKSSSNLERTKKSPSSRRRALKGSSGHSSGKQGPHDALKAFNDSFGSLNSFEDENLLGNHDKISRDTTDRKASKSKSSDKKKDKSSKSKSSNSKSRTEDKKSRKKRSSSVDADDGFVDERPKEDLFSPKSPAGVAKSWWNLNTSEKSPSSRMTRSSPSKRDKSPSSIPATARKTVEASRRRENWKKGARTKSAPLAPVNFSTEDLDRSFSGDPFRDISTEKSRRGTRKSTGAADTTIESKFDAFGMIANDMVTPAMRGVGRSRSDDISKTVGVADLHRISPNLGFDPFQAPTNEWSARRGTRTLGSIDHSGHIFGKSQDEKPNDGNEPARAAPARAKSSELPSTFGNVFDMFCEDVNAMPPPPPDARATRDVLDVLTGALQPSKRDFRRSRSSDRSRPITNRKPQRRDNSKSRLGSGVWGVGIPGVLTPAGNNDNEDEFELHVDGAEEPLSPITIATKKPVNRPAISRRRGF